MKKNNKSEDEFENLDIDPVTFKKIGYEVIDAITEYYSTICDRLSYHKTIQKKLKKFLISNFH